MIQNKEVCVWMMDEVCVADCPYLAARDESRFIAVNDDNDDDDESGILILIQSLQSDITKKMEHLQRHI